MKSSQFYRKKEDKLFIGLMCGTSADGVDVALCKVSGYGLNTKAELLDYLEYPIPPKLKEEIFKSFSPKSSNVWQISQLNFAIGHLFAAGVNAILKQSGLTSEDIEAIGSHGQTVYHVPEATSFADGEYRSTLQLGSPAVIAEDCNINVVSDFRSRDMAAGGQGAPLVPYIDYILFSHQKKNRIMQNIGGIANFTFLPKGKRGFEEVLACDSGPGNMVIDGIAQALLGLPYDPGGSNAAQGQVDEKLLKLLLDDSYFSLPPPKSTGRERYGKQYVSRVLELAQQDKISLVDLLATVTELSALTITGHYQKWVFDNYDVDEIIVSGGGVHNKTLMKRLKELCSPSIKWLDLDDFKISPDAKEALAFALLANETLCQSPNNLPQATGAVKPVVLGSVTYK